MKWNADEKNVLRHMLITRIVDFNNLVQNSDVQNDLSVDHMVNTFTDIVREVADPIFVKHVTKFPCFERCVITDSSKWFDQECRNSKNLYKML